MSPAMAFELVPALLDTFASYALLYRGCSASFVAGGRFIPFAEKILFLVPLASGGLSPKNIWDELGGAACPGGFCME